MVDVLVYIKYTSKLVFYICFSPKAKKKKKIRLEKEEVGSRAWNELGQYFLDLTVEEDPSR